MDSGRVNQAKQALEQRKTYCEEQAEKHRKQARRTLTWNSWLALIALVLSVLVTVGGGANALGASGIIDTGPTAEKKDTDPTAEEQPTTPPEGAEEPPQLPRVTIPGTISLWSTGFLAAIVTIATGIQKLSFANVDKAKEYQTAAVGYMRVARLATESLLADEDEMRTKLTAVDEQLNLVEQQAPTI
jgi:hypothetical protein